MRTASNLAVNAKNGWHPPDAGELLPVAAQLQEPFKQQTTVHRVGPEQFAGHTLGMELNAEQIEKLDKISQE